MKYLNIFFIILFLSAAFLQWNDPDPALWISVYLAGAFLCFTAFRKEVNIWLFTTALCFFGILALYLFFIPNGVLSWLTDHQGEDIVENMSVEKPWIEKTREFFGLLIVCLALGINMIWTKRQRKKV